jgi:hypothetical protein
VNILNFGGVHSAGGTDVPHSCRWKAVLPLAHHPAYPKVVGMIKRLLAAALCLLAAGSTFAQLRVELNFEQETYLPEEPMNAIVRIYNSSGQTLVFGTNTDWLTFSVESADGKVVKQKKTADVLGEFSLPSAHRAKKFVNLAEAYDLSKFGRYYVTATVRIPQWQESFSNRKHAVVGISTGVKLWETPFGLPGADADSRPEIRKYQLIQANHLNQLTLYIRITDEGENFTYNIFPLGGLVGFSKPEPQLDKWSNLHVLYQDGARSFRYNAITPAGMLLAREVWDINDGSRPTLKVSEEGRINVAGGARRISASDVPPPELLSEKRVAETNIPAPVPVQQESAEPVTKNGKKSSK